MQAPPIVLVAELIPALSPIYDEIERDYSVETINACKAVERLLVTYLFENDGFKRLVLEFGKSNGRKSLLSAADQSVAVQAQVIASVPDKARRNAPTSLLSPHFYNSAFLNALLAAEEYWISHFKNSDICKGPLVFTAELCARFCRRGHADAVVSQILFKLLDSISLYHNTESKGNDISVLESTCSFGFWTAMMDYITDIYAVERLIKALLLRMSDKQVNDADAYLMLYTLFSQHIANHKNIRLLFTEKILDWTNLPLRCLKWILHFAIFCHPPVKVQANCSARFQMNSLNINAIRHFVQVWAEERFIQSAEMQKQLHITAAICISLGVMTKQDTESSPDFLKFLLHGISRRLESPIPFVRKIAKKVALAFSLLVDETNPLLLDEVDNVEDLCDWEVPDTEGENIIARDNSAVEQQKDYSHESKSAVDPVEPAKEERKMKKVKHLSEPYDPDEVIDLRTFRSFEDDEADSSENKDSESECSLEPYDLSDDESDIHKNKFPMQLRDCAANLRKGDEPEVVEKALEVAERLVRARPEELENVAPDLVHALIHVRCSDVAVEGQEESAEKKRYDSLVALLACAPLTVDVFTGTLYSPHVDISQRILILEVMSDAAREIANSGASASHRLDMKQITEIDKSWYGPGVWPQIGAGPWKEIDEPNLMVSLIRKYERELPPRRENFKDSGKSRRWGHRSMQIQRENRSETSHTSRKNNFATYAPSFMLPVMRDYDKKQQGVDLIGRDFVVLGRLICMLGVCMECISLQPEACILGAGLVSMLSSKRISGHPEVYVRRATLYAISRVMLSLHPSQVKNAINGEDEEIRSGLKWIHSWALEVAENDTDRECSTMALACLQIHSELLYETSRLVEPQDVFQANTLSYKYEDSQRISFF
ncbi:hypothetical protein KP509_03G061400 [Ceratopteris richardii]|nr:hypothetical protein KP509_03G061400 [Ceratopteris richardii]